VDSDSWGPIKQPDVGGSFRSIRRGEFSTPKVWVSRYFCLMIFSEFFVPTFLQEPRFLLQKRVFDTFEVRKHAILELVGHEIQILIT